MPGAERATVVELRIDHQAVAGDERVATLSAAGIGGHSARAHGAAGDCPEEQRRHTPCPALAGRQFEPNWKPSSTPK